METYPSKYKKNIKIVFSYIITILNIKVYFGVACILLTSQFAISPSISGRFFGKQYSSYISFRDKLYFYNDTLLFYRSIGPYNASHHYYDYNMINDSTIIIDTQDTSRLNVVEETRILKKLFHKDITFVIEAQSGSVPLQFESLDLYVLTNDNDTIIYKSEKISKSMYLISIDNIVKIKAFWGVLSNDVITEKYIVKSKKSNFFDLYVYI